MNLKKIFILMFLLFIFLVPTNNNQNILNINTLVCSGDANQLNIVQIRVNHNRGNGYANMEMDFSITDGSSTPTAGMFSLESLIISKSGSNIAFDIRDGTYQSLFATEEFEIQCISTMRGHYSGSIGSFIPLNVSTIYKGDYVVYRGDISYRNDNTGTLYSFTDTDISYSGVIHNSLTFSWHLEPIIKINSSYYNLDNLIFEFYMPIGDTIGSSSDLIIFDWVRQSIDTSIITYPYYKIRILDQLGNIVFEDVNLVLFKFFREITIPSFKIQNNYDKIINFTYTTDSENKSVLVNPYSNVVCLNETSSILEYTITDQYNNTLLIDRAYSSEIVYNNPESVQTLITLIDQDNTLLDFNNYNITLNSERIYNNIPILQVNSTYNLQVQDILGNLVHSADYTINKSNNIITIPLNVYQLKIMNLMITNTTILIENDLATYDISDISNPNELLTYKLQPAKYNITYTNELGSITKTEIDLTSSDYTFIFQTLQKDFTISLFDESGFGVSMDNVRMYYDNVRTSGFLRTFDGTHNIKILDYFNTSLFDQNVDITPYTEFNVYLPIYTLIINNNYSQQMRMVIEREGVSFAVVDQVIPALSSYQFRFAANLDYIISMIYLNGTYADNRTINLASNVQIESFGYYSLADITQIDNSFSGTEIGLIIAVIVGLGFISIQSLRKPKIYKSESPIPILSNNPKYRGRLN